MSKLVLSCAQLCPCHACGCKITRYPSRAPKYTQHTTNTQRQTLHFPPRSTSATENNPLVNVGSPSPHLPVVYHSTSPAPTWSANEWESALRAVSLRGSASHWRDTSALIAARSAPGIAMRTTCTAVQRVVQPNAGEQYKVQRYDARYSTVNVTRCRTCCSDSPVVAS